LPMLESSEYPEETSSSGLASASNCFPSHAARCGPSARAPSILEAASEDQDGFWVTSRYVVATARRG
jgi:hypothetical protein